MRLRHEFALRALSGREAMADLCREYGISRKTGYKWRERFIQEGLSGLAERPRTPASTPNALSEETICRIITLKLAHKTWGPRKLLALWKRAYLEPPPSESSIKRILTKTSLITPRRRRASQSGGRLQNRREATAPNQVWTVDFKGWWSTAGGKRCEPLTVRDAHSRYILFASPLENSTTQSVRAAFETIFTRYGLPETIRSDNGIPFAGPRAPLGLSRLSAWWIALGISLDRIAPGRPDQNGAHERMHRDIAHEIESHARHQTIEQARASLAIWRRTFNEQRPHEALAMKCPADLYTKSPRPYQGTPEDLDYPLGYLTRRVNKRTGTIRLKRKMILISTSIGGWSVGLQSQGYPHLGVYFGPLRLGEINLQTESFSPARAGLNDPTLDQHKSQSPQ